MISPQYFCTRWQKYILYHIAREEIMWCIHTSIISKSGFKFFGVFWSPCDPECSDVYNCMTRFNMTDIAWMTASDEQRALWAEVAMHQATRIKELPCFPVFNLSKLSPSLGIFTSLAVVFYSRIAPKKNIWQHRGLNQCTFLKRKMSDCAAGYETSSCSTTSFQSWTVQQNHLWH